MPGASSRWSTLRRALLGAAAVAAAIQVIVGLAWWLANVTAIPAYGDSPEYVTLAHSLRVDGYRTIGYPVLVRAALSVASWSHLPWQTLLYALQAAVSVAAAAYVIRGVIPAAPRRVVVAATAMVVTPRSYCTTQPAC